MAAQPSAPSPGGSKEQQPSHWHPTFVSAWHDQLPLIEGAPQTLPQHGFSHALISTAESSACSRRVASEKPLGPAAA